MFFLLLLLLFYSKLGQWIAQRRTAEVQKKYQEIGGGSPILKWTHRQGELLCKQLDKLSPNTAPHKHYVAFRYVKPFTQDAFLELERSVVFWFFIFILMGVFFFFEIEMELKELWFFRNILNTAALHQALALMPSTNITKTGCCIFCCFFFWVNNLNCRQLPKNIKFSVIDRWATHPLLAKTHADLIRKELAKLPDDKRDQAIILFSAHSLPLKVQIFFWFILKHFKIAISTKTSSSKTLNEIFNSLN